MKPLAPSADGRATREASMAWARRWFMGAGKARGEDGILAAEREGAQAAAAPALLAADAGTGRRHDR